MQGSVSGVQKNLGNAGAKIHDNLRSAMIAIVYECAAQPE